ncbi:MAG: hypothetical protein OEY56_06720, partial [Cyclobacteriaceae bacterium]|nr:hypothetical protein [Cyclobacteriaceae bacterium]
MRTLLVFFCSLILFFSCNQIDDCQLNPYSEWLSVQVKHRTKAPLYFDSLTVEGLGRVAYDPTFALSSFSVPLDFA